MTRRLYIDLDGVLADFDQAFARLFNMTNKTFRQMHGDQADNVMWPIINDHQSFFKDMPTVPEAWRVMYDISFDPSIPKPIILTACPKSNYAHVAKQKREWVREHLGDYDVLPVYGGVNKPLFMHAPGDVLVDDHRRNVEAWEAAGGLGILHRKWDDSMVAVRAVFRDRHLTPDTRNIKDVRDFHEVMIETGAHECVNVPGGCRIAAAIKEAGL